MNNAEYRKCLCPGCNCGEDCNGFWGTPNQDKAYQCCWSVGDKVKMTHVIETNFEFKGGGIIPKNACYRQSYSCGRVREQSSTEKIEVEYVCIGARGNAHLNPNSYADLPDYINGVAWKDAGGGADPNVRDGWNVSPVVYIPVSQSTTSQAPDDALKTANEGDIWEYGQYLSNIQHISGCFNNWPYQYEQIYNGFVAVKDSSTNLLYWEPIPIPTDEIPKIETSNNFCSCIDCFFTQKNVSRCGAYKGLECDIDENGNYINCVKLNEPIQTQACDCGDTPSDVPPIVCENFNCEYCLDPDNCKRLNKCNPDSDCSCFIPIYIKEQDLNETDHGYEVDEEGYILDTDGNKIPSGKYRGRYEHSIYQSATIFALDLTNTDIQYCEYGGYFIERQVGPHWQKYELQPFLVLFNRPILEWDCDCKDSEGNYILPDGVGEGYRKEVYGGFSWYFWSGTCDLDCEKCTETLTAPAPCVAGCESILDDFEAGTGIVPCTDRLNIDYENGQVTSQTQDGVDWLPFSGDRAVFSGFSTADFFRCTNCVEGISSCAGFKSYCIKRRNVTPEGTGTCPGECQGFYGVMQQQTPILCESKEGDVPLSCNYGCAELALDLCEDGSVESGSEIKTVCDIGQAKSQSGGIEQPGGSGGLIFPPAYQRSICESYTIHTLTIEPVQEDQRRCLWYDFQTNNKNFRCCGKAGILGGSDVGSPINIEFESNTDNDFIIKYNSDFEDLKLTIPNNLEFSWTEGIGWVSSCEDLGNPYIPDTDEENADGNGYTVEILCDVNPSVCSGVQCSGTTTFGVDLAEGVYPCLLSPQARTCCQLPYDIACVQDSWWPHGKQNYYGSNNFWFIQENVSNGNVLTGCSCIRPSCSCYSSSTEEPEGRYTTPGSIQNNEGIIYIPECDLNNYSKISYYYSCFSGCKDYVADIYGCAYDPDNHVGTTSNNCFSDVCQGKHAWPDGCDGKGDGSDCPTWCSGYCESNPNLQVEGWVCIDCNELCPDDVFKSNP